MIKFQGIEMEHVCRECSGTGRKTSEISMHEFMDIVDGGLSVGNKIEAIKDVRTKWGIGLKDARDLIEAYQTFLAAMPNSNVKWDWERR